MIKRSALLILLIIFLIGLFFFLRQDPVLLPQSNKNLSKTPPAPIKRLDPKEIKIDGKKVVGPKINEEKDQTESFKAHNYVSDKWEENLEKVLRTQAGDSLRSLEIKKVDSFIWNQDNLALHVESVIITVKNKKNHETSFRALVDAQTGKILKTWDQPVFDPVNPKDNFKIKIDPRYHSE
jgi:hypothetical protein